MARLLCNLLGHRRNRRRAHPTNLGWRCDCRRCGEQLLRVGPNRWVPLAEARLMEQPAAPDPLPLFDRLA